MRHSGEKWACAALLLAAICLAGCETLLDTALWASLLFPPPPPPGVSIQDDSCGFPSHPLGRVRVGDIVEAEVRYTLQGPASYTPIVVKQTWVLKKGKSPLSLPDEVTERRTPGQYKAVRGFPLPSSLKPDGYQLEFTVELPEHSGCADTIVLPFSVVKN